MRRRSTHPGRGPRRTFTLALLIALAATVAQAETPPDRGTGVSSALRNDTVGAGGLGPQTVPHEVSLTLQHSLELQGYVFKNGYVFMHDYGSGNTALGNRALGEVVPEYRAPMLLNEIQQLRTEVEQLKARR